MVMEVWRLEGARGDGAFSAGIAHDIRDATGHNPYRGPCPITDGLEGFRDEHRFGCRSPEELFWWFSCRGLNWAGEADIGARVVRYVAPREDVLEGGRQVAFDRTFATEVEVYCPSEFAREHCVEGCCVN